ncbi:immunity 53 family protein [Candidatus Protochlamydia phocaeensis]|uniref:immunity 53 family protein n=1 Tax=Candidatus Protochlamydia phocaeensis TaxID=1414722 RepID=UPI0008396BAF|nr:immunity 53 family protein [Candidatus Protochlamydia phocaeensis]
MNDNLIWLLKWYYKECDGDWEHQFGVKIETLDNPGWSIQISIQETDLQDKKFQDIDNECTENDWIFCRVRNGFFEGYGGPLNLPEILQIFREWAESNQKES